MASTTQLTAPGPIRRRITQQTPGGGGAVASAELIGILSVGVTLLIGLGGLIVGLSLQLHSELRNDLRQSRDENGRQHGELAARIDGLYARVDGLSAQP